MYTTLRCLKICSSCAMCSGVREPVTWRTPSTSRLPAGAVVVTSWPAGLLVWNVVAALANDKSGESASTSSPESRLSERTRLAVANAVKLAAVCIVAAGCAGAWTTVPGVLRRVSAALAWVAALLATHGFAGGTSFSVGKMTCMPYPMPPMMAKLNATFPAVLLTFPATVFLDKSRPTSERRRLPASFVRMPPSMSSLLKKFLTPPPALPLGMNAFIIANASESSKPRHVVNWPRPWNPVAAWTPAPAMSKRPPVMPPAQYRTAAGANQGKKNAVVVSAPPNVKPYLDAWPRQYNPLPCE
ncbi:Uncharacterised protein [uncultured archaeon]|nr:Uncharacterised protein [uncultured archaeon]